MPETSLSLIHRFVPGPSNATRTLLLLHGTGGDETDLLPLGPRLDPEAHVLSPRGAVLENGMPRFFRRLALGVFDEADLRVRTADLADFVEEAARVYDFAPRHVFAAGFSNGANIAASLLLLKPSVLEGAILFSPMVPLQPDASLDLSGVPVFIGAAEDDPMVEPANTRNLAALLDRAGADVTIRWKRGGHSLGAADVDAAHHWLRDRIGSSRRA